MRYWILCSLLAASVSHADWALTADSALTFLSIKNTNLTEVHHFRSLSGSLSDQGQAELTIDLASIDSGIPIRDERMQKFLFDTSRFTSATLTTDISADVLAKAAAGSIQQYDLSGKLALHGSEEEVRVPVLIVPAAEGSLVVTSLRPVLIQADAYGMAAGIQKLRDIAKLQSIGETVPVSFSLVFAPQQ